MKQDAAQTNRHPTGLYVLAGTELAERFSYYGMTALLPLYMVKQLLLPGHVEHVAGLGALRHAFEFRGTMSDASFASLIYGWYSGLVYFTPLLGGWIADRWIGSKRAVALGAILMTSGHLAMSLDKTFLLALLLLITGSGFLKGNISAQVGKLYPPEADSMRERGFTIFSTGINIGAVAGPIATGAVALIFGWHAGFTLAAALMLLALIIFLAGSRYLPNPTAMKTSRDVLPPLTSEEKRRVGYIVLLIALLIPVSISYPMIWNIGVIWVDQRVDLVSPFGAVPASWFNSVDSFASVISAPFLVWLWAWQARHNREPRSMSKIAIGAVITGVSALILASACLMAGAGKVPVIWPLICWFGMGLAFMWYWPVTLAMVSRAAPAKLNSTLVSASFLALFFGSTIMGWVGSFYDQMSNAAFWTLDAAIALASAVVILMLKRRMTRVLEPESARAGHSPG